MGRALTSLIGLMLLAGCAKVPGAPSAAPANPAVQPNALPSALANSVTAGQAVEASPPPAVVAALAFSGISDSTPSASPSAASTPLHFFFCSDTHDGYALFDQMIAQANAAKPAFMLDGGDLSEQGTANEFKILNSTLSKLTVPFVALPGNHDYKHSNITRFDAQFGVAPRSFDVSGVHFILVDDANQQLSDATFQFLERDLAANQGKTTVVSMHVPVEWKNTPADINLLHKIMPGTIAEPKIEDAGQVSRFESLMSQYHVSLVLSGHTHLHGDYVVKGVPYVVAGAAGGKLMNVGADHEYVDVTIDQGKATYTHVALDKPTDDIGEVIKNMLDYYLEQRKEMASGIAVGG